METPLTLNLAAFARNGETRREAGRIHFTEALGFLLRGVSHPELTLLADWACNEEGNLHTSQISHLRNAKMRMLGVKALDALGRINVAAFVFKTDRSGQFRQLGTATTTARVEEILKRYEPLVHPVTGAPLDAGDLMLLYLGYLELPIRPLFELAPDVAEVLAQRIGPWVGNLIEERGFRYRDALTQLRQNWTSDRSGAERFSGAVAGMSDYSPADLARDWSAITAAVGDLIDDELDPRSLAEMVAIREEVVAG